MLHRSQEVDKQGKTSKNAKVDSLPRKDIRLVLKKLIELPAKVDEEGEEIPPDMEVLEAAWKGIEESLDALPYIDEYADTEEEEAMIKPAQLANAIAVYMAEEDSTKLKVVTRANRAFRLYHGGKKRAVFLAELGAGKLKRLRFAFWILLVLIITQLGLSITLSIRSPLSGSTYFVTCIVLLMMLLVTCFGMYGEHTLLRDMANDLDGVETKAQLLLATFFFGIMFCAPLNLILGVYSSTLLQLLTHAYAHALPRAFAHLLPRPT